MSTHFDVVVLGAGPGGYVAAIRAAQLGLNTAVIEKQWWGGVCLNVGCIPTKSLMRNAEVANIFTRQADLFGIEGQVTFRYDKAFARSRAVSDRSAKGVHFLMKKNRITELHGWGDFRDARSILVTNDGVEQLITFDHCIIAAGSTPRLMPGTRRSARIVTYEEQILSADLPASIVILGVGTIGVEFAYLLASYGVDVTIIGRGDRLVRKEDPEVSAELGKALRKLGVKILTGTRIESIEETPDSVRVSTAPVAGGATRVLETDRVLQALGFIPRTTGYGLERTGVTLTGDGAIAIDDFMRTSVPGVYAVGDVTGKVMLAHAAEAQGIVAAETIAKVPTAPIDYDMVPKATYCQPQVASLGYTAAEAQERGHDVKVSKFSFLANGKAQGLGHTVGFVKIIADGATDRILGAHMIGPDVTELLPELVLAQQHGLTATAIGRAIHAHPTLSEAIKEAAEGISGHMING